MKLVIMGVSGCGKSSVGKELAIRLNAKFTDGDDLHPKANLEKMASGIPLVDDDRWPWLSEVGKKLLNDNDSIIACSALKRSYREKIREFAPDVIFIHLHGDRKILESRLKARSDHFMPKSLLDSQLNTLEPLAPDENGKVFDISKPVEEIVSEVMQWIPRKLQ